MRKRDAERTKVHAFVSTLSIPAGPPTTLASDFVPCEWTSEECTWPDSSSD